MRRKRSFLLLFLAVCIALLTQATPGLADKRVALVIGNAKYKNTPALINPTNDATDVAQALTAIGFEVTLALDVDKRRMDQALADFARASTKADASLFYYAGHGMQFQGHNYIMPVDADLQDEISLRYEMTAVDEVKAAIERTNGVRVMVLDACRNNPLAQRFARSIVSTTRGDAPNVQGYARPEKTQGMVVAYATQADDVANDGFGRNSPFSEAFLKEIKEPGLEIGTMFRRIGEDVYQSTNGRQSPELSISVVREYYLNQAETDQAIWARIRANADADTIREFLNRYPNSFFAPDAKARLDLLDDAAREKAAALQLEQQKAQAARLQQEQAARERIASEARAREQDLAAKLATAEAERQQMAAELAQKAAAQADADRRQQSERAKAEDERQRREADLRAQIAQQATASQIEKDRLLREALAEDDEKQKVDEQARAERERVAKEGAEKELQAQAERAQALKDKIAQLEQQASAAQANVTAAEQKAADAQKAASQQLEQQRQEAVAAEAGRLKKEQSEREQIAAEARAREQDLAARLAAAEAERQRMAAQLAEKANAQGDADPRAQADRAQALKAEIARLEKDAAQARANVQTMEQSAADAQKAANSAEKVAALAPPRDTAAGDAIAFLLPIQAELRRLGCYAGADPDWNSAAMKRGVARFAQYARLAAPPDSPSAALLDDLKERRDRVCPSECSPREVDVGGRCVARTCGPGEFLGRNGACIVRPAAPRQAVAAAAPKARAAAPAAKGHCFSFNGNQYCE